MGTITRGLALIEYALLGIDGTVGTVWRQLGLTDRDSAVSLIEADPTKDAIYSHELDPAIDIEYTMGEKPLVFSLINPTMAQRAFLMGGTLSGSGLATKMSLPDTRRPLELAIRVLPKKGDIYQANRVLLWGKHNKDWAKSSKIVYDCVADVLSSIKEGVFAEEEGPDVSTIRSGILTAGIVSPGASYTVGSFTNVPLVTAVGPAGGQGALATIVVAGGAVTTVTITTPGKGYHKDSVVLAPSLAGGSGFEASVATITT